jgi:eukaryotic-like serine/threonine-protein kinase
MGTPSYMAPELAKGAQMASASSDVFSFGVVAFELLSKQLPHAAPPVLSGGSPARLADLRPDLDDGLRDLVDRCLQSAPSGRPKSHELAVALSRVPPAIS